jgi:hypothetical protein
MNTQSEALETADELEANILAVAKGKMKPGKMPIEPICRAYSELRRLHHADLALQEWLDKTEWVQGTGDGSELGMHIADVLKKRIERLQLSNTELLKELKRLVRLIEVEDAHLGNFGEVDAARAVIAKQPEKLYDINPNS